MGGTIINNNEKKPQTIDFNRLVGETASLYYCNQMNRFQLGSVIFEVIEDKNDGYRSYMKEVLIVNPNAEKRLGDLLGYVKIVKIDTGSSYFYELHDTSDNHVWLRFGTDSYDDYYPCFGFNSMPKNLNDPF